MWKNVLKWGRARKAHSDITTFADSLKATSPIELVSPACPYCGVVQVPPPQRRKKCRDCGETICIWTDHENRKKCLVTAKEAEKKSREESDHRWKELSHIVQIAMRAGDWRSLQGAYQQQARILFNEGRPHHHVAIEARRAELMRMYEAGISEVKVRSSSDERVCQHCSSLDGTIFSIEDALAQVPIPGTSCTDGNYKNLHGGRCRCVYEVVIPRR